MLLVVWMAAGCSKPPAPNTVQPQDTVEAHPRPKRRRVKDPDPAESDVAR
jgi:hypothetical protein